MKRAYTVTIGCIEALHDENRFRVFLRDNGWEVVDRPSLADLILVNTCGYRVDQCVTEIRECGRVKQASAEIIVCGCLPRMAREKLREVFEGRCFGPRELDKLADYLAIRGRVSDTESTSFEPGLMYSPSRTIGAYPRAMRMIGRFADCLTHIEDYFAQAGVFWFDTTMSYIKVATGCLGSCSYCAIRFAKGSIKSRAPEQILEEFRHGLAQGQREFVLCGEDVGAYGYDISTSIVELLAALLACDSDCSIHLHYMDPRFLILYFDQLCEFFGSGRIASLCVPVQSGSNAVLQRMNKKYTAQQFAWRVRYLNAAFPWLLLRTHAIVGFPGETDEDFSETCRLLASLRFNQVSVYMYQALPYNPASTMHGQVPHAVKLRRARRLKAKTAARKCAACAHALIEAPRAIERRAKALREHAGRFRSPHKGVDIEEAAAMPAEVHECSVR